ncbi:MAG: DNA polymerase III subunit alpha [Gemmatimonadetes bacterium]|nr:DNA polymerase III subunit alpha [Gemmatimonadota bacterium]MYE93741.1 DNA polymerase III subunit alpha [Gemmatimonadota bacterium]MYJ09412.1 DNA polymerase III subunit alpha [Gemmatimonadota bacterium]
MGRSVGIHSDVEAVALSFVHLHTHSEYSLLDGANRLKDLVRKACEFEMPALALTDHGCMYGAWTFQKLARKDGVKPIIGMEAYVAPGDRRERARSGQGGKAHYHLVLLARDAEGYRNLIKLSSIGYTEGFYYRPRLDREILARHSNGLIVTSACMAGELARHLNAGNDEGAREVADWYANAFPDRYYLEVQAHGTPGQAAVNKKIFALADDMGLPVVATNDAHFLHHDHHAAHDILVCIGTAKSHDDEGRLTYDDGLYFKSHEEMAAAFPGRPEVIENTLKIADEVSLTLEKKYHLPRFPLPERFSDDNEYLVHLAEAGARERYGSGSEAGAEDASASGAEAPAEDDPLPEHVRERLDYELAVILKTGYAGYFLITWDFIRWARENGIPVGPGRGSAAGSLVSYALRITDLDPIEYGLLFERFLNPERISMPDIDIDFCYERRGEVIEYVRRKYGRDAVGQIITFGTMKSRAVIRDVGRVLGFDVGETDRIAKKIPNQPGQSYTVAEAVKQIRDVKALYASDDRHRKLFDYSITLEGLSRHASVHAAGVVIAPGPLSDYVPICTQGKGSRNGGGGRAQAAGAEDGPDIVTQYDMNCLEDAGMLKMDFLGLKTLTVIHDAVRAVKDRLGRFRHPETGTVYESDAMDDVPLNEVEVYRMLASGGTSGVFQFESNLALDKLRAMRCDRFDDLVATNALIRPGPLDSGMTDKYIQRKLGRQAVKYPAPGLEHILEPTYGIIVYQEQVMLIASDLAGYSLAEADVLRKAMGKKDAELIRAELDRFQSRVVEGGLPRGTAARLAGQIETFGRYGFNKSHSVAYSLLSYKTAWLKRYYPAEFMAALLSSVLDKTDDVVKYIGECRELGRYHPALEDGLVVLAPDVNESGWKFTVVGPGTIRFGLGAVRGVGAAAVQSILGARSQGGPFGSLFDFLKRIDLRAVNKRACEALIASGALDSCGHRAQLLAGLDAAYGEVTALLHEAELGQGSLFGGGGLERPVPALPTVPEWGDRERLTREKEALGFFISGHPLDRYREIANAFDEVGAMQDRMGDSVEMACVVTAVARQVSRRDGSEWAKITVEGFHGTATVLAFKDVWQSYKGTVETDAVVLLRGKVSDRDRDEGDPPVFLDAAEPLGQVRGSGRLAVRIDLGGHESLADDTFASARAVADAHPGAAPVEVVLTDSNGSGAPRLRSRSLRVSPDRDTIRALEGLFGKGRVGLAKV